MGFPQLTGSGDGFARFYAQHTDVLLAHFMRRVLDVELALELTAETMAQAFLNRHKFRGSTDAEATAWLYTIADRKLATYYRRNKVEDRAMKRLGLERPQPIDETEAQLIKREALADARENLQRHLKRLSPEQREVVELRFMRELNYPEIAQLLQISEQAARARLARGLRSLREALDPGPGLGKGVSG